MLNRGSTIIWYKRKNNLQKTDWMKTQMIEESVDLPIALRKGTREATSRSIQRCGLNDHDIGNYVSYEAFSHSYQAFVASLHSVHIPTD
jgi:hypothetical protein